VQVLTLDAPLRDFANLRDRPFIVTQLGKGDRVRVCNTFFGQVWPPHITPQEADVTKGPVTAALSTRQSNAQIRYTLDGSDPADDSPLYVKPLAIRSACTLKTRTFAALGARSRTAWAVFSGPRRPDPHPALEPGLLYRYYEGEWRIGRFPDLSALRPLRTGAAGGFGLDAVTEKDRNFAVVFEGFLEAPKTDLYALEVSAAADFECRLFLGDGQAVTPLDRYAYARPRGFRSIGEIGLEAGTHALKVVYVQGRNAWDHRPALKILVGSDGRQRSPLPSSWLWRPKQALSPPLPPVHSRS
jgi:hypothetical protein